MRIFAGYNKSIRIFDIHRPGRDFAQYSTTQGNKEGQPGIISAVAFSSTHTGMLATGSYNQTNAIYREDSMELLYILYGQEGGITHVQFSKDGNYLYTGGRKDPYILCWDVRKAVEVVYKKVYLMIYKMGSGFQDFRLQQTLLMVSLSTHSFLWRSLHQGTDDFKFLMIVTRICT
eukprot:XP_024455026.1 telomerase Cajal body protein 1 isoform X1 [Populus trichocarpa]